MPLDWRAAYFQQAKSDYEMLLKLMSEEGTPACQSLHYLQMTTEKLAKGFLTQPGGLTTQKHTTPSLASSRSLPDSTRTCSVPAAA